KKFPNMRAIRIGVCTMPPNVKPYLGENLILETDPDKMDFFIFTEKAYACHPYDYFRNAPLVVETKRSNIRLGGVLDVRRSKDRLLPKKYINRNYNVDLRIRTLITNNPNLDYDVSTWTILDKRLLIPMVDFTLSDALYSEKLGFFPIIYHNSFMLDMNTALSVNRAGSYKISISADNGARVTLDGKVISEIQVKEQFDRARRLYETKEVEVYLAKGNHHLNIIYSHIPEALVKIIAKYKRTDQNKYFMIGEDSKDVKFIPYSRVLKESRNFSYN
ncbi:MAG: PA14 domain-containing protein, partial [Proteobacteria bacterium]|nr:PA14 domain-containing protein [Pseudomonadota bacterium]